MLGLPLLFRGNLSGAFSQALTSGRIGSALLSNRVSSSIQAGLVMVSPKELRRRVHLRTKRVAD